MGSFSKSVRDRMTHIRQCASVVKSNEVRIDVDLLDLVIRELSALEDVRAAASASACGISVDNAQHGPRWLDLPDASIALGISDRTIRRRIRAGAISARMRRGRRQVLVGLSTPLLAGGA